VSSAGVDFAAALDHARTVGGPALRAMSFHERAALLRSVADHLTANIDHLTAESAHTGATASGVAGDLHGGIGVLKAYASLGRRELPDGTVLLEGDPIPLSRDGSFLGAHILTPLQGVAVQINAFNFPVWGMLEKLGPTWLAGMPAFVKAAPQTSYVTELCVRLMIDAGLVPDGALQFTGGEPGDLLDHVTGQDVVAFTGSAATAQKVRVHPAIVANSVRFTAEADSLNAAVLTPSAGPGTAEFDLFADEVVREMASKSGQKCTCIRRVLVPETLVDDVKAALVQRLDTLDMAEGVGALVSLAQRDAVRAAIDKLRTVADVVWDGADLGAVDDVNGAFCSPVLLEATDTRSPVVHTTEAFGPVATIIAYTDLDDATRLAALGEGSLVGSIYAADPVEAAAVVTAVASHHGRLHIVDATAGPSSTAATSVHGSRAMLTTRPRGGRGQPPATRR
jgi:oxepin-CoA hydrolase/3-oxo-5,6-dehydrosuberyl-CoA semialdehyde dehydrogenase